MDSRLEQKIKELIESMPKLLKNFKYREGPDLYFYKRTTSLRREKPLAELFDDEEDRYIELIYATLVSWDMNSRGAKMKYFDEFKSSILYNKKRFLELSTYILDGLQEKEFEEAKRLCEIIYSNLDVMKSSGKLVSNSKTMHFILPDLIMPMDRQNTLNFFFGNTGESKHKFLKILECSYDIAKKVNLRQFLDNKWNQSITKAIDNAIISHMSPKYAIRN
jgi:hypothetical protein